MSSQLATNSFYGSIVEILAQASEQGLDLADKRLRVLLMIFHHFRSNPSFRDPSCFQSRQLDILRLQTRAYMALVQGVSPPSSSLLYLSNFHITPPGRALAATLASRPPFHVSQFVPAPPPLDGPEGAVDWPGQLFPQLRVARTRKRVLASLTPEADPTEAVSRVVRLIDVQRRVRAALLDQHKRPRLPLLLPGRARPADPIQTHTKFLHELLLHRQQFLDFHRRKRETLRRVGHAVARKVAAASAGVAAPSESAETRLQRERIAALKAQDEEAYLRLLAESKNERLNELIRQTEDYMRTLGALVVDHKASDPSSTTTATTTATTTTTTEGVEQHGLLRAKAEYFALTHSTQEVVSEQPLTLARNLKLRDYQLKGLEYLVSLHNNRLSGILADEQGLGKSATTISFLAWLWENRGIGGPFMIIAPLSVLKSTWVSEIKRWCPVLAEGMVVYEGNKEVRKELKGKYIDPMVKWQSAYGGGGQIPFTVVLTTDAFILKDQSVLKKVQWEYIIVDEAHRLKNPKSKLVQLLNKNFNSKSRLALTGTPLQNDLQEVWALLNFLMPRIFASNDSFRDWFAGPLAAATSRKAGKPAQGADQLDLSEEEKLLVIDRLHKVLKPFILRRTKSEVMAELPRKTEQIVWCRMTGVQIKMYDDLVRTAAAATAAAAAGATGGRAATASALEWEVGKTQNLQMNLRKVCNHPYLFAPSLEQVPADESLIRSCGKLVVLDGLLARLKASPEKHRVLIFSQMTKVLDLLELYMNYRDHSYVRLDGNTSSDQREEVVKRFSAPNADIFCFLLSTRSGGLGLNLISADTCVLFDQDFNPAGDEQAKARTHRIGQTRETLVIRLVTRNSIEERMLEIAEIKQQQDELVIQQGKYHHDGEQETIEEKREKLLEILGRRDGFGRREDADGLGEGMWDGGRVEMERAENERWLFDKVDIRMSQLGLRRGIEQRVIPSCLLKEPTGEEGKMWKEAYQGLDKEYSLKLLVKQDPRAITGSSDFEEELKIKRHKLNEAVYVTMSSCLKKFGWTEKQAPVLFDIKNSSKNGAYMSLHEVERSLQRVLDYAANTEYFWCFKLIGALNCRVRRVLWPPTDLHDFAELASASSEDEDDEDDPELVAHIDDAIGFTKFLDQ